MRTTSEQSVIHNLSIDTKKNDLNNLNHEDIYANIIHSQSPYILKKPLAQEIENNEKAGLKFINSLITRPKQKISFSKAKSSTDLPSLFSVCSKKNAQTI